ncbi:MAG: efflux RND transporter periplasmic adaptor subunit [Bacteroidales bacterium]
MKYIYIALLGFMLSCSRFEKTTPQRISIESAVFASGHIEQEQEYIVSATVNGILETLLIDKGDLLRKGDLLAILQRDVPSVQLQESQIVYRDAERNASPSSPHLLQLQAQIRQAREQLNQDKINLERYEKLRKSNSISQLDFEKAQLQYSNSLQNVTVVEKRYDETREALLLTAERSRMQVTSQQAVIKDYQLLAVDSGQVIDVYKKRGELVRVGESVAKIGSGDYLIRLMVSEDDITKVEIGQEVAVHLNTYPREVFEAKVTKVLPGFNAQEQSYEVEARFQRLPERMFPGTQLQANIRTAIRNNVLVIPSSFLQHGKSVLLADRSLHSVNVGERCNDWVEIISGISEDDIIIKNKK